jgi:serine/threonine protein kinase
MPPVERDDFMQPQLIAGRYQVLRLIGRGGMGTVWLCRDERLGREVAVKQINALPGESATETKRAMREARSAAALNHPNAVAVYDVVDHDARPWLVMEYVDGQTLADEISRDGRLSPKRVADIGAQVAGALARAHELRIVHRDIKPANVLIDKSGRPKISDFGIARGYGDDQLTRIGYLIGTPEFLSPELARGGDFHPASDVWALGATLYAAVEGQPPFESRSNPLALLQVIATDRPGPMTHAGALGPAIDAMMHEDPARRWEMATCAQRLAGITVRAAPPVEPTLRMEPADELTQRMEPAAAPLPDDRGSERRWIPLVLVALLVVGVGGAYLVSQIRDQGSKTKTFSCSAGGYTGYIYLSNTSKPVVSYKIAIGNNSGGNSADVDVSDGGVAPSRTYQIHEGVQDGVYHAMEGPYRRSGGGFAFTFVFDKSNRKDPTCSGGGYLAG